MKKLILILILMLFTASAASAAISNLSLVVNNTYSSFSGNSSARGIIDTNTTLNFTFNESIGNNYTNITFPAGFIFGAVANTDITNNTGASITVGKSATMINLSYTAVAGGRLYFNISKIKLPSTSGDYAITIATNATTSPSTVYLYARDSARPYYLYANNSVFTVASETFGANTTTITLTGKGYSNLTLAAPNVTTQGKVLVGWGATNASLVFANRSNSLTTLYIEVDPTVQDPVIVVSLANELEQANLPAAIVAIGATLATLYVVYRSRRRTR